MRGPALLCGVIVLITGTCFAQSPTAEWVQRTLGHAPPAGACDTQEFRVNFRSGSAELSAEAGNSFRTNLDYARPCNVSTLFVAGHDAAQIDAVRNLLMREGLNAEQIQILALPVPIAPAPYEIDQVRVTIVFR